MTKILVVGHSRHGKDTVADILSEVYGLKGISGSRWMLEAGHMDDLATELGYTDRGRFYTDRHLHRKAWFDRINKTIQTSPAAIARGVFRQHDVYTGIRTSEEYEAVQAIVRPDMVLWVDRSTVLPPEPSDSNELQWDPSMLTVWNGGTIEQLRDEVIRLMTIADILPKEDIK